MRSSVRFSLLTLMVLSGCGSREHRPPIGEVRVISIDAQGNTTHGADGLYDFGIVPTGTTAIRELVVQNVGSGDLSITGFSKVSGTATSAGEGVADETPVFTLSFDKRLSLRSTETVRIPIEYAPVQAGEHHVVLTMQSANDVADDATITLRARAVEVECDAPVIDFGEVATGDSFTRTLEFVNAQPAEANGFLALSADAGAFSLSPDSPTGEFTVAAQTSRIATFSFAPMTVGNFHATARMRWPRCPEQSVQLIGTGVSSSLSIDPAQIDFGFVSLGASVTRDFVLSNPSSSPVILNSPVINDQGSSTPSTVFQLVDAGSSITVPPAVRETDGALTPGTVTVQISFAPTVLGRRNATFKAALEGQPLLGVPMTGVGGGPDIEVTPSPTLDAGVTAYFPGTTVVNRVITVRNVGTRPSPPDAKGNLKLGVGSPTDGYAAPYWEVIARTNSTLDEICVGIFDTASGTCTNTLPTTGPNYYLPHLGLEAGTSTGGLDIPVRIAPASLGLKEWEVRIFSSDADDPVTTVVIRLDVKQFPACDITVTPASLDFGVITTAAHSDLSFSVHNNSTTGACLLTDLRLGTETGTPSNMTPIFSLPSSQQTELTLAPNTTEFVTVRAEPQGQPPPSPAQVTSKVLFTVAHPNTPQREASLTVTVSSQ